MSFLKIDIKNGLLEVDGDDALIKLVYEDYKGGLFNPKMVDLGSGLLEDRNLEIKTDIKTSKGPKKPQKVKTQAKAKESFSIIKDLDLSPGNGSEGLLTFYESKAPRSLSEINTVFIYYLQKVLNLENIGVDHIYTCFKEVKKPVPTALKQSLWDTASKKGWINTNSLEDIKIAIRGENLVEQELGSRTKNGDQSK